MGSQPQSEVQLVRGADDICCFCPHLKTGICLRGEKRVDVIDSRVMEHLGLSYDSKVAWNDLLDLVAARVGVDDIAFLCRECSWRDLDFCSDGLASLADCRQKGRSGGTGAPAGQVD